MYLKFFKILILFVFIQGLLPEFILAEPIVSKTPEELRLIFEEIKKEQNLQTEIPIIKKDTPPQIKPRQQSNFIAWLIDFLKDTYNVVTTGIIVITVIIFFYILLRYYKKNPAKPKLKNEEKNNQTLNTENLILSLNKIKKEANNLASNEFFTEAIHILLLKSLNEFKKVLKKNFPIHLTSREILFELRIKPTYFHYLNDIVSKVELSYFGSYLPGEEDYKACRNSFDSLLKALNEGEKV